MMFEDALIFAIYAILAYAVVLWVHYSFVKEFRLYKQETDLKIKEIESKLDHLLISQAKKHSSSPPAPKSLYSPPKW